MIRIVFDPWDRSCPGAAGDTLLETALEHGVPLEHACGGDAVCSTCAVRILAGGECLEAMEDLERETLDKLLPGRTEDCRLACQTLLKSGDEGVCVRALSLAAAGSPSP